MVWVWALDDQWVLSYRISKFSAEDVHDVLNALNIYFSSTEFIGRSWRPKVQYLWTLRRTIAESGFWARIWVSSSYVRSLGVWGCVGAEIPP